MWQKRLTIAKISTKIIFVLKYYSLFQNTLSVCLDYSEQGQEVFSENLFKNGYTSASARVFVIFRNIYFVPTKIRQIYLALHTMQYAVCSLQYALLILNCLVCSDRCAVFIVLYLMCIFKCALINVQCLVHCICCVNISEHGFNLLYKVLTA